MYNFNLNFYVTEMILNFICMNKWGHGVPWVDFFCLNPPNLYLPNPSNLYFLQQTFLVSDTQIALFFLKKSWTIGREWTLWVAMLSFFWLCSFSKWGSQCDGTTSHVLLENFQKSSITSLQVDIGCDAPEMGIICTEGVLSGLVTCITPIIHHSYLKIAQRKIYPSLGLATGNQSLAMKILQQGQWGQWWASALS